MPIAIIQNSSKSASTSVGNRSVMEPHDPDPCTHPSLTYHTSNAVMDVAFDSNYSRWTYWIVYQLALIAVTKLDLSQQLFMLFQAQLFQFHVLFFSDNVILLQSNGTVQTLGTRYGSLLCITVSLSSTLANLI